MFGRIFITLIGVLLVVISPLILPVFLTVLIYDVLRITWAWMFIPLISVGSFALGCYFISSIQLKNHTT